MKLRLNSLSLWFGIIMILLIVSGAIAITFTDVMSERLYGNKRIFFVIMLLAYAVYRGFRLKHVIKEMKDEE